LVFLNFTYMKYSILLKNWELSESPLETILAESPRTIFYFYPKDNTPGCTTEAQDFTRLRSQFEDLWIRIIWVSKDDGKSHEKFRVSCALGIDLLSDSDGSLHEKFTTIWAKNLYGKIIQWVIRSTFLLDSTGKILKEWRNVKATWHAEKVLKELKD
jgi:peroxiredoxin Q/BCP